MSPATKGVVAAVTLVMVVGSVTFALQFASPDVRNAASDAALAMIVASPLAGIVAMVVAETHND